MGDHARSVGVLESTSISESTLAFLSVRKSSVLCSGAFLFSETPFVWTTMDCVSGCVGGAGAVLCRVAKGLVSGGFDNVVGSKEQI